MIKKNVRSGVGLKLTEKIILMKKHFTSLHRFVRFVTSSALVLVIGGASVLAQAQDQGSTARIFGTVAEPQGEFYATPAPTVPELVRVTYYRPGPAPVLGSARLEVNGRYHTSLQVGSFTEVCLPSGNVDLGVRLVQNGLPFDTFAATQLAVQVQANQRVFLRITDRADGRTELVMVDPQSAQAEIKNTRRQRHAVSRVQQDSACIVDTNPSAAQGLVPVGSQGAGASGVQELVVLGVGTLFAFGESSFSAITPQGREELTQLVERIQNTYGNSNALHIQVTGHADPIGNARANQRLSAARAQAVRSFMVQKGIRADRISSRGVGSSELIVSNCSKNISNISIECNRPNRRVVVSIQMVAR